MSKNVQMTITVTPQVKYYLWKIAKQELFPGVHSPSAVARSIIEKRVQKLLDDGFLTKRPDAS